MDDDKKINLQVCEFYKIGAGGTLMHYVTQPQC